MKIVVVENSVFIRDQLLHLLEQHPRLQVIGATGEESEAVRMILERSADAVLLDLSLSPGSGVQVLRRIRSAGSGARVLVLTNNTNEALKRACLNMGAHGFYDKSSQVPECINLLLQWLPPLPDNESLRLQQLQSSQLLDSPSQEVFDNLTQLAAEVTGSPIALISLVDQHRQWFLSQHGLDARETSRSVAFCAHTILHNEMMEIPDARADERFRDNPLVTGLPHVRFYAGVPLVLPSGEALGTLCVIDHVSRNLSDNQRRALKTLSSSAVSEIELRRRVLYLEQEVERRRAAEAHIQHLMTRDPLTGLPNRSMFCDRLEQQVRAAARRDQHFAVLFIDLDRFKPINDTLGHDVGDLALMAVGERLMSCLRACDTVARLGGDEFSVLLTELAGVADAQFVAQKIVAALHIPLQIHGHTLHVGGSVGLAIYPEHGHVADELLRHADLAMYQAKQNGGGQTLVYEQRLGDAAESLRALEIELREAIGRNELVLHFQPQIIHELGSVCGVEALVRWNHPRLGLLSPDHFIPLAEQRGLCQALTLKVLDLALSQLHRWDKAGIHVPHIAVNISSIDIQPGFPRQIEEALTRHSVPAHRLELEITETTLASDSVDVINILHDIRDFGVKIAVDDFGVGYSSLAQIHRLPIDCLKIDRGFVRQIESSVSDMAIVQAVVTMAAALGLRTVAEGVEQDGQRQLLEEFGVHCAQGYLFCRPLPAGQIDQWLVQHMHRLAVRKRSEDALPRPAVPRPT